MDSTKLLQIKLAGAFNLASSMSAMSDIFTAQATAVKVLQQQMEPMRKALEVIAQQAKRWVEMIREVIKTIVEPLKFLFTSKPIYNVPQPAEPAKKILDRPPDKYLTIEEAQYGYFKIDGHELKVLNPSSSRCGRLLQCLLNQRAEVVDYKTLREHVKTDRLDKDFKDLKRQLSKHGYKLDYDRPPGQGICARGLVYLQ
ncbi:MAG: hypothetical protein M3Q79_04265 [bacterium]|nr:hypothetical protein [bacterium]